MNVTGIRRRPRRLVLGVVVPLALVAAVGGTAVFLMRAHASSANAAATPATGASKDSVSGSLVSVPALSKVAASGDTVVAVGSQDSAIPSFSVSADGGRTWTPAFMGSQAGPVAGHPATTVAGGPGGWVGLGPQAVWVSTDGTNWTLVSARGLAGPGETITDMAKDSWGTWPPGPPVRGPAWCGLAPRG